ncbi:MAG: magnesium transporter, partial [Verrucomicrobiota bacterium]
MNAAALTLAQTYAQLYPEEIARDLETAPWEDALEFLSHVPDAVAGELFNRLTPEFAGHLFEEMSAELGARILAKMELDRAAQVLARLPAKRVESHLRGVAEPRLTDIRELMSYAPDSAGHLMNPRVMAFRKETRAEEALARIRAARVTKVHDVFLIDDHGILTGVVSLQDLALADSETPLGDLAKPPQGSVRAVEPSEEVVRLFEEKRLTSVPIVDYEGKLLGVVRYDVLMSAAQEEAVEDLQSMVGVSPEERALSPAWFSVKKRLPWLQINLATAFLAAAVVGLFEETIAKVTALAVLLPVVAGQSGNTGAQALAVAIRGLTLKEIRISQWFPLLRKEAAGGFMNGVAVALVTGLGVWIWNPSLGLVMVISIAMVISMTIAAISGATVPLILKACNQDPAQSSSIILTTVTDVVGFFSFLGLAKIF